MKKRFKKVLSMLTVIAMLASCFAMAIAEEPTDATVDAAQESAAIVEEIPAQDTATAEEAAASAEEAAAPSQDAEVPSEEAAAPAENAEAAAPAEEAAAPVEGEVNPVPSYNNEETPADNQPADEQPADEQPADEQSADEQPADEQPADEQPADEQPADEQPADEQPADEQPADEQPADEVEDEYADDEEEDDEDDSSDDDEYIELDGWGILDPELVPEHVPDTNEIKFEGYQELKLNEMVSGSIDADNAGKILVQWGANKTFVLGLRASSNNVDVRINNKAVKFVPAAEDNSLEFVANYELNVRAGKSYEIVLSSNAPVTYTLTAVEGTQNETIDEINEEPIENITEEVTDGANEEITEEVTEEAGEETTEEVTEEAAEETTEEVTEEAAEETTEEVTEEAAEETTEEVTEESAEETTEEVTEEAAEEATEEVTEEAVEETTEEVTEEAVEETTEEVTEEATEETTEEVTEEAAEETTEEVTEEAAEDTTEEVTEEAAEETTEEVTEEATEETTEETTEEAAEETTEEVTEEAAEETTEEVAEEAAEETTEEVTEEAAEETTEEVTEEASEETTEEVTTEEVTEEAAEETTEEVTEDAAEETAGEVTEEAASEDNIEESSEEEGIESTDNENNNLDNTIEEVQTPAAEGWITIDSEEYSIGDTIVLSANANIELNDGIAWQTKVQNNENEEWKVIGYGLSLKVELSEYDSNSIYRFKTAEGMISNEIELKATEKQVEEAVTIENDEFAGEAAEVEEIDEEIIENEVEIVPVEDIWYANNADLSVVMIDETGNVDQGHKAYAMVDAIEDGSDINVKYTTVVENIGEEENCDYQWYYSMDGGNSWNLIEEATDAVNEYAFTKEMWIRSWRVIVTIKK